MDKTTAKKKDQKLPEEMLTESEILALIKYAKYKKVYFAGAPESKEEYRE